MRNVATEVLSRSKLLGSIGVGVEFLVYWDGSLEDGRVR